MERIQAPRFSTPFPRTCRIAYCAVSSLFVIFVSTSALNSSQLRYQLKIPWHYMEAEIDYTCVLLSYSGGGPWGERPFRYRFGRTEMDIEAKIEKESIMERVTRWKWTPWYQWSFLGFQYLERPVFMRGSTKWFAVSSYTLAFAMFFPLVLSRSWCRMLGCFAAKRKA
jgi:hypothetical protein